MARRCLWYGPALYAVLASAVSIAQSNGFGFGATVAPHGVPASVTSFGFGGHPGFHGVPASVTSVTFGSAPLINPAPSAFCCHHHRAFRSPFYGAYYVPYAYPVFDSDSDMENSGEEDNGPGPTIFDRHGGRSSYAERSRERTVEDYRRPSPPNEEPVGEAAVAEVSEQPRTLLVFKDGSEIEVSNYAIIGPTLYDLSDGRTRRIQLAQLDLAATVKENDERGVEFELPRALRPD